MGTHPIGGLSAQALTRRALLRGVGAAGAGMFLAARGWNPSAAFA